MNTPTTFTDAERRDATSASNAQADLACPGRHKAQRGLTGEKSEDASFGDRVHAALAKESPEGLSLEEEEVFCAGVAIRSKVIGQFFGALADEALKHVWKEERFWARFSEYEHSGRADFVCRAGPDALVVDYKTLNGETPESPQNLQLRDLACLIRGTLLITGRVAVAIVQPLVTHSPLVCVYTAEDLDRATAEMFARVAASNNPASPRVAGETQCKFCLAKKDCAEYAAFATAMVPEVPQSILTIPISDWTPAQRSVFCEHYRLAHTWLEETWQRMKDRVRENPDFVPGWGLDKGRTVEKINNPQVAFERFLALGGKDAAFLASVTVGKTKLKEAVAAATGERGKALDARMKTLVEGIVDIRQDASSLVRVKEGEP
jgi:hypothetical protein